MHVCVCLRTDVIPQLYISVCVCVFAQLCVTTKESSSIYTGGHILQKNIEISI